MNEYNNLPGSKGELVPLVQKGNFDGGPHLESGLENARRYFIAQREIEGADTPIGHRWSNMVELTQTIYGSKDPAQREFCIIGFARNLTQIIDLKLGREIRRLSPAQLLLAYSTNQFH